MSERILGRAAELEQVGALLADEAREARSLVLTGDAGVGKTTIWEEGVRLAGERGLRVLAARPAEGEAALPFAALGDLIGPVVESIDLPLGSGVSMRRWTWFVIRQYARRCQEQRPAAEASSFRYSL
jgi:AAA ATPase-like protein